VRFGARCPETGDDISLCSAGVRGAHSNIQSPSNRSQEPEANPLWKDAH